MKEDKIDLADRVVIKKDEISKLANIIPGAINKYLYFNNIIQEAKRILGVESPEVKVMEQISNALLYNLKKLTTYRNKLKDDDDHKDLQDDYNEAVSYLFKYEGPISDKNRFVKVDDRTKEFKLNLKVNVEGKEYPVSFTTLEALSIKLLNNLKFNEETINQLKSLNSLNQVLLDAKVRLGNLEEDSEKKLSTIAGNINKYNNGFYFFKNRKVLKILNGLFPSVSSNVEILLIKVNDFLTKLSEGESLNEEEMNNIEGAVKFVSGESSYEELTETQKAYIEELMGDSFVCRKEINLGTKEIETHEASLKSLEDNLNELNDYDNRLNKTKKFINNSQSLVKKAIVTALVAAVVVVACLGASLGYNAHKNDVNNLQNDINNVNSDVDKSVQENENRIDECLKNVVSEVENLETKSVSWNLMVNGDQAIEKLKTYSDFIKNYLTIEKDENGKITSIELKSAEELDENSLKSLEIIEEPKTGLDFLNNLSVIAGREYTHASESSADLTIANSCAKNITDDLNSIESSVKGLKDPEISQEVWKDVDFSDLNDEMLGGTIQSKTLTFGDDNSATLKILKWSKKKQKMYMQIVKIEDVSQLIADGIVDANDINYIIQNGLKETYEDYSSKLLNKEDQDQTKYFFIKDLNSALTPEQHEVKYYLVLKDGTTIQDSKPINNSGGSLTKEKIVNLAYRDALNIDDSYEK